MVLASDAGETPTERLVLLVLASHAGREPVRGSDGRLAFEAWPSVATIGREARITQRRTVQRALRRLEKRGALETHIRGGRTYPNVYRIVCERGALSTTVKRASHAPPIPRERAAIGAQKGARSVPPEPKEEPLSTRARVTREPEPFPDDRDDDDRERYLTGLAEARDALRRERHP